MPKLRIPENYFARYANLPRGTAQEKAELLMSLDGEIWNTVGLSSGDALEASLIKQNNIYNFGGRR